MERYNIEEQAVGFDTSKKWYIQTGFGNDLRIASLARDALNDFVGVSDVNSNDGFGILLNPTEGLPGDTGEFFEPGYTVLDALTAQSYKQLNAVGDQKLIVPHSAGNNDLIKGLELTALNNEKLSNLHFLSVGSPVSHKKLSRAYAAVGANDLGQVNNLLDPVTYPRVVQVGLGAATLGAMAYLAYKVGYPLASAGWTTSGEMFKASSVGFKKLLLC